MSRQTVYHCDAAGCDLEIRAGLDDADQWRCPPTWYALWRHAELPRLYQFCSAACLSIWASAKTHNSESARVPQV